MILLGIIALFIVLSPIAAVLLRRIAMSRRVKLMQTPPPDRWISILEGNLPITRRLSDIQRARLFGTMNIFLSDKKFEGCGGLEVTEEIKVTIAAQACMLLIGHDTPVYPRLKTILVYPHTYRSGNQGLFGGDNGEGARLGESWTSGVVVLAWDSVLGGAGNMDDGHNVTFHEFAHQLDQEDGAADGAPILEQRSAYIDWARVFQHEYEELVNAVRRGQKSTLDEYGATNPAEFFAVATEAFFEKPRQLREKHRALYEELQSYYRIDPVRWHDA